MGLCALVSVAAANIVEALLVVELRLELEVFTVALVRGLSCVLGLDMTRSALFVVCCIGKDCSL